MFLKFTILYGLLTVASAGHVMMDCNQPDTDETTIYDFTLMDVHKRRYIRLSNYRGKQEPGNNGTEIMNAIKYVRPGNGFVPNFQIFEKVEVNGNNETKLFTYLKRYCPPTVDSFDPKFLFYTPIKANDVSWNFEKFLVGADGRVIHRVRPGVEPQSLEADIEAAIVKGCRDGIIN